jgi:hypothetical protein
LVAGLSEGFELGLELLPGHLREALAKLLSQLPLAMFPTSEKPQGSLSKGWSRFRHPRTEALKGRR